MKDDEPFELKNQDEVLRALRTLEVTAPVNTIDRMRKRLRTFQLGRELLEKQVYGFWIVLDALLTVVFRLVSAASERQKTRRMGERR